jgi:hypothetical protein
LAARRSGDYPKRTLIFDRVNMNSASAKLDRAAHILATFSRNAAISRVKVDYLRRAKRARR